MTINPYTSVILDRRSGTFFDLTDACVIDVNRLSDEQLEVLNEGTDTERLRLADEYGVVPEVELVHGIAFDVLGHIKDNWSEDIPEGQATRVAELAKELFDCTTTWNEIDRCVGAAWAATAVLTTTD